VNPDHIRDSADGLAVARSRNEGRIVRKELGAGKNRAELPHAVESAQKRTKKC
jgi:hypothetical protein